MGRLLLGKKGAIYSLPENLTVGGNEGPEILGLCTETSGQGPELPLQNPELPVVRKFLEQTSGAKIWTPSREKTRKRLSQIFLEPELPDHRPEFPDPRKFTGKLPVQNSGIPPERNVKKT